MLVLVFTAALHFVLHLQVIFLSPGCFAFLLFAFLFGVIIRHKVLWNLLRKELGE